MIDEDEYVVLVDELGRDIGSYPKLQAHIDGLRHKAISVLIVNRRNELLLQQRSRQKYHSGGLWTNACCSHPRPGEAPGSAAGRRLQEEMGFGVELSPLFIVEYRAQVGALIEDEYVYVFGGHYDGVISPDPSEVDDFRWLGLTGLEADLAANPDDYTVWFSKYMKSRRDEIIAFVRGVD